MHACAYTHVHANTCLYTNTNINAYPQWHRIYDFIQCVTKHVYTVMIEWNESMFSAMHMITDTENIWCLVSVCGQ